MRVVMDVTAGPRAGESFVFDRHKVVLMGRSDRCGEYCLGDDTTAGRTHLILEVNPPVCRIRDLGSKNHTYINGNQVAAGEVTDGDIIGIGATRLVVRIEESEVEQVLEGEDEFLGDGIGTADRAAGVDSDETMERPGDEGEEPGGPAICARCGCAVTVVPSEDALCGEEVAVCDDCRAAMKAGGEEIPGYRLVKEIARGGMGVVWEATDTRTGQRVAIKTMIPEIAASTRMIRLFLRESRISLSLDHPRIVKFISAGQFGGQLFVAMEYVDGVNAETARRNSSGRLPLSDVVTIGLQALDALAYAHGQNLVHRDVKPGNILLSGSPGNYECKLTDFGLARNYRTAGMTDITKQGELRGSIPFMAREQVKDPTGVDQRTDIFGLGATLYNLLTGEYVYAFQKGMEPLLTIMRDEPVPVVKRGVSASEPLAAIIDRAISVNPEDRFASAAEMRDALASAYGR